MSFPTALLSRSRRCRRIGRTEKAHPGRGIPRAGRAWPAPSSIALPIECGFTLAYAQRGVGRLEMGGLVRPLRLVQQKLGLPMLSHHRVGQHSIASQAVTSGESVKAVQAQLRTSLRAEHAQVPAPRLEVWVPFDMSIAVGWA